MGQLPLDPDLGPARTVDGQLRAPHLNPRFVAWVALGGILGTGLREAIVLTTPTWAQIPVATLTINVIGAFCLAFLLETLVLRGDDTGRRRTLRLMLGTGVLGGFTTYSALATDAALLIRESLLWHGVGYAVSTVALSAAATIAGIAAGAKSHHASQEPSDLASAQQHASQQRSATQHPAGQDSTQQHPATGGST